MNPGAGVLLLRERCHHLCLSAPFELYVTDPDVARNRRVSPSDLFGQSLGTLPGRLRAQLLLLLMTYT